MIRDGVTLARSLELTFLWNVVFRIGPVLPLTVQDFETARSGGLGVWLHVVEDLHRRFSDYIHGVVVNRREEATREWRTWLREEGAGSPKVCAYEYVSSCSE